MKNEALSYNRSQCGTEMLGTTRISLLECFKLYLLNEVFFLAHFLCVTAPVFYKLVKK